MRLSSNATEKRTLESKVPEIKIEKCNRETNSNINVEKPSRKWLVKVKFNHLAPESGTDDEMELLTGIGSSSTRNAEIFKKLFSSYLILLNKSGTN